MARRKKSGPLELAFIGVALIVAFISAVPKEIWILVGGFGAVWLVIHFILSNKKSDAAAVYNDVALRNERARPTSRYVDDAEPVGVPQRAAGTSSGYRIPSAPKTFGNARWIPPGETVEVAGTKISGGMLYVGTSLTTPLGYNDPSLIDPSKPVASRGNYTDRDMGYWPSYSEISTTARRAYLNWLAGGRSAPNADIGYVFIFFYGLERRAIIDAANTASVQADWPIIATELRRLLAIYGDSSSSFRRYASELLDWVSLADHPPKLYEKPVPSFPKTFELPLYVRLALGQATVDGAPIPGHLALAWVRLAPNVSMRTPATRCAEEFDRLFKQRYAEAFGNGIVIPRNRTKLKLVYRPASAGFRGYKDIELTFGDTPDVTVLTAPIKKLQQISDATIQELDGYSRFVGKNPDAKASLEGLLQLPVLLWPPHAHSTIEGLKQRAANDVIVLPFQELLALLGAKTVLTKDKTIALAKALASQHIGFVPDVLYGAKAPKPEEIVALFSISEGESGSTPSYQAGLLTLQMAAAVAYADGDLGSHEFDHLKSEVGTWAHLASQHVKRLVAHLHVLRVAPISLTALKKKLEPLDATSKEAIGAFMATVAQSDGTVSPAEVKMLEKVYKALGIDAKKVFSDIHAATAGGTPATPGVSTKEAGFKLDPNRIFALQKDTERVSALLGTIFTDEEPALPLMPEPNFEDETSTTIPGILGLDEAHTAFARQVLSRTRWSREELLDVAADLELMLDGALEQINEAAFDAHDMPLTEGEDPVEVNTDILEKVAA
jgi:uncharacterized tellurite resistance protein B-like protein